MAIEALTPYSRRRLLTGVIGGLAAAGAATLASAQRVLGAGDDGVPIAVGDVLDDVRRETLMVNQTNGNFVFRLVNRAMGGGLDAVAEGTGVAVRATGKSTAVAARGTTGTGVWATHGDFSGRPPGYPAAVMAESDDEHGPAVIGNNYATTGHGHGVQGLSDSPQGWANLGWARAKGTALIGYSGPTFPTNQVPPNTGVFGYANDGRGGVFRGGRAQVRLVPSSASTHPATGQVGDLFLDKNKRLWFCKGGSTWKQLA